MSNFQQLMQDEIRRLARKEVKPVMENLLPRLVEMRKTIQDLQKRIKVLENMRTVPAPAPVAAASTPEETERTIRLSAAGIIKIRTKLKLNQTQFAVLLGVSPLSVRQWESGNTTPRAAQKAKIAACRHLGKRELMRQLAGKGITPGKRTKCMAALAPATTAIANPEQNA